MDTNITSKNYVVSGATSGIGLAVAEILVRSGAGIIGLGRSQQRCREVERRLRGFHPDARVDYLEADLSVQSQVRDLAARTGELLDGRGAVGLDGLANVAGTFTYWLTLTPDGIETQWAVNHLAGFLLTHQLLPRLLAAPLARVVTVSSDSHYGTRLHWEDPQLRRHYNGLRAYGNTKLANILFTLELNRRLGSESSVRAFAADPGLVKTDIGMKGTPSLAGWIWKLRRSGGISPEEAARGIVFLLCEASIQDQNDLYWKHGRPKAASRPALDPHSAAQLWTLSQQLCNIPTEA